MHKGAAISGVTGLSPSEDTTSIAEAVGGRKFSIPRLTTLSSLLATSHPSGLFYCGEFLANESRLLSARVGERIVNDFMPSSIAPIISSAIVLAGFTT